MKPQLLQKKDATPMTGTEALRLLDLRWFYPSIILRTRALGAGLSGGCEQQPGQR